METMKVKPWGKNQGDYVIINVKDFDPKKHHKLEEKQASEKQTAEKQTTKTKETSK